MSEARLPPQPDRRHVTIADVAREAGVDPSTVSRVLNGRATVRHSTRLRVHDAARRMGYHPSRAARGLASAKTWTLGVLLPDFANLMHVDFLRGVQRTAQERGYSVVVCDGQLDAHVQAAELDRFLELRVDGVIVSRAFTLADALAPLIRVGVPVEPIEVLEPRTAEQLAARRIGSTEAFRRIFELGHRDAAIFVHERADAPTRSAEMRSRIDSLDLARAQMAATGTTHIAPVADADGCELELRRLLAGERPPTALIAGNDWMTAPLLGAIRNAGLDIPGDVSVVAYGDSRWAAAYRPPISVIRYDYYGEGRLLAERVLQRLGELTAVDMEGGLAVDEFVDRGSLGPARAR